MKTLSFKAVASTLSLFGIVTYTVCILWNLAFPQFSMVAIWKALLPGFQGITWGWWRQSFTRSIRR